MLYQVDSKNGKIDCQLQKRDWASVSINVMTICLYDQGIITEEDVFVVSDQA